jgi:Domain of unknown function (DUF4136)
MRRLGAAVALLGIAVCAGCSRFTVESAYDPAVSFQGLKTYAWKPGAQPSLGDPRVSDTVVDTTVRGAVDRELNTKGFTKAAAASADLLVAYDGGINVETSTVAITRSTNAGAGAWVPWQHLQSADFEQGTVVLMIFNPQGKLVWRGVATGIFDPTATQEQRETRIAAAIRKLLKPFPPQ